MLIRFAAEGLPEYHDNMLLVKVRPSATTFGAAVAQGGMLGAPGLSALATMERAGMIRRIIPLDRTQSPQADFNMVSAMMAAAPAAGRESTPLGGVNMVELERGADNQQVRLALANDPNVESVARVPVRYFLAERQAKTTPRAKRTPHAATRKVAASAPSTALATPPPLESLWNLAKINWRAAIQQLGSLVEDIRVAVLDTGIDLSHPDLPGDRITLVTSYPNGPATSDKDIVGHGTHVSGTICARIDNGIGINGICACRLSVYKIFSDEPTYIPPPYGSYFTYTVDPILYRKALADCLSREVKVINLSIGGYGQPDPVESQLFQSLIARGISVVAAMGNDNTSKLSYPAAIPGVIAVGATKLDDVRSSFSNFGPHIALTAPGSGIWSTLPTYPGQTGFCPVPGSNPPSPEQPMTRETDYASWDGTSMATPHVTAAAALALTKHGTLTPAQMKTVLMNAVDKVAGMDSQDFTNYYGAGRLNLLKL